MEPKFPITPCLPAGRSCQLRREAGFTLMELVVAMTLFIIVASIATGAFIHALKDQRDIRRLTSANSNISQALEIMAREVRTGENFSQSYEDELTFKNYKGHNVSYKLLSDDGAIGKCEQSSCAEGTAVYAPITSEKFITALKFYYQGIADGDRLPPRITISVTIKGLKNQYTTLQTTVSSKNIGS